MKYNFIIPYRNRKEHLNEFTKRFTEYLKDKDVDAQFYIIHQINSGDFNRGALLNIGFLEVCKIRPDGLFIFHDVDIYPTYWGSIIYDTKPNEIRHPIGEKNSNLGTISCFWKKEFEMINGFPNYWGWGIEDITILYRAKKLKIHIDETNIISLNDRNKCHNPGHYKYTTTNNTAKINTEHFNKEMISGIANNGLSNLEYNIICKFELIPNFTVIDVDFKLKKE